MRTRTPGTTPAARQVFPRRIASGQARSIPAPSSSAWKRASSAGRSATARGGTPAPGAERGEVAGRLAGVPLDRVQAEGAVGDVRGAEALAGRDQVLEPLRDQRGERQLERAAGDVEVGVPAGRRVQVDPVVADPHGVGDRRGAVRAAHVERDVLLDHRAQRRDPPRLAHVRRLREAVGRVADDVAAQPQPGVLPLHPAQEVEAERAGARVGAVEHRSVRVVDLRPVHERDVARVRARLEQAARRDPAEPPQVLVEVRVVEVGADRVRVLVRVRDQPARHGPVRPRVGRGPRERRRVARRRRDRVVLARAGGRARSRR